MTSRRPALILVLAAQPEGTSQIRLDEEAREIRQSLRDGKLRDEIRLESRWATRPVDVMQALSELRPDVVHFSSHGTKASELLLESVQGHRQPVTVEALGSLFSVMGDTVKAVVLNSCFSGSQAVHLSKFIDVAIGMQEGIGIDSAIHFSSAFYRGLSFGKSFQQSFEEGKTALLMHGILESHIPILHSRPGSDPRNLYLLETSLSSDGPASMNTAEAEEKTGYRTNEGSVELGELGGTEMTAIGTLEDAAADPDHNVSGKVKVRDKVSGKGHLIIGSARLRTR